MDCVLQFLDRTQGTLLDIGCGSGFYLAKLNQNTEFPLYGLDLSLRKLKYARSKVYDNNVSYIQGDAENLPFKPGVVTIIFASRFLHHFAPRHEEMMKKIHLMLCPRGQLIIAEGWTISPERTLFSNLFFYFPRRVIETIAVAVFALNNPAEFAGKFTKGIRLI